MAMTIHREGYATLTLAGGFVLLLTLGAFFLGPGFGMLSMVLGLVLMAFLLWFFRHPDRPIVQPDDGLLYSPADGRVVVIEEAVETEYFQEKRLMLSVFMSVTDVHLNRVPLGGRVAYFRYHPGKYLVAWHPKSSTENERNTIVIDSGKHAILMRQIAGAVARRINTYLQEGQEVKQGAELGFIKFGSRVDLYLPLGTELKVRMGEQVYSNRTVLARLP